MVSATVFTSTGTKSTKTVALDKAVFGVELKDQSLLKQAYLAYLANKRNSHATTLRRGQVSGGGRKPWRQKGTGRARAGSIRMPHWTGGGVVFGPTGSENHHIVIPKKARRLAIKQALSLKANDGAIMIIEKFDPAGGKTKAAAELLNKLGIKRRALLVVADKTSTVVRATRNLPELDLVQANYLNVFKLMNADQVVITSDGLQAIAAWLSGVDMNKTSKEIASA